MSKIGDALGERMKGYERNAKIVLDNKQPVIIRLDGKAFHSFTRGMERPFDEVLLNTMKQTMKYMCSHVQNCVFGYTQSDEITLVLVGYKNNRTSPWFGNNAQKIASVSASMATMYFNKAFIDNCMNRIQELTPSRGEEQSEKNKRLIEAYSTAIKKGAMFDSRAFNVPKHEVVNNMIWRQRDAIRNSIQSVGYANFSSSELHKKNTLDIRNMLLEKGIDWESYDTYKKMGTSCYKIVENVESTNEDGETINFNRNIWVIDENVPEFMTNKKYIECRL